MSRNNSTGTLQGFSISQPFLGAALQFYPALGTPQLDDLINAFLPGSASIKEKRATISMDFFEYSQLTGETFKYYPVFIQPLNSTTASSAGSSPNQDSGYSSNFVSPVISDWSWSQSTPGSASASTPASVAQDAIPCKTSKKAAAPAAKSQNNDFSHVPGMKIMTKDGRDVTNSASRGCKTKEQRDHAHLMRIIKACEACRKKKVRCDPSHKKRAAAQLQSTTPVRSAKKAKTSVHGPSVVTDRSPQQQASLPIPSAFGEPSSESLGAPDLPFELCESWESFVQFDDEPASAIPFDYDFFFDPEGHLSPSSRHASATAGAILSQPLEENDLSQNNTSELHRTPILPYLDATAPANTYVDFNLFSPEPSFLDEDTSLVDIGVAGRTGSLSPGQHRVTQGCQLTYAQDVEASSPPLRSADRVVGRGFSSSLPFLDDTGIFSQEQPLVSGAQPQPSSQTRHSCEGAVFSTGDKVVPQNDHNSLEPNTGLVSMPRAASRPSVNGVSGSNLARLDQRPSDVSDSETRVVLPVHRDGFSRIVLTTTATASRSLSHASPAQSPTRRVSWNIPGSWSSPSSDFSTSAGAQSGYTTAMITCADDRLGATSSGVADVALEGCLHSSGSRPSETRGWTASPSPLSTTDDSDSLERCHGLSTPVDERTTSMHRSSVLQSSAGLSILCVALLAMAWHVVTASAGQSLAGSFFQIAFGNAVFNALYTYSSLHGSRPQQSRLSSTPKLHSFSDGARLLSCVSTRLRHFCLQNTKSHHQVSQAGVSTALGFTQGLK